MSRPSRRTVLLGALAVPLAACTDDAAPPAPPPPVDPDVALRAAAVAREQSLVAAYDAVLAAVPAEAARLTALRAEHLAHLEALGAPAAPSAPPVLLGGGTERSAHRCAAGHRRAGHRHRPPGRAAHRLARPGRRPRDARRQRGQPPGGARVSDVRLLTALLAAEHAAVYGYGVLGGRLDDDTRPGALTAYDAHRARRDSLAARLRERGAAPPVALPAYDVRVADRAAALALAVRLEEGLAVRWRDLVAGTDDLALRTLGSSGLQEVAVRAAQWRRTAGVRPVTVALPGVL